MIERWHVLLVAGLAGAASVARIPLETVVDRPLPPWLLRGAQAVQVAILTALAVWVGEATAPRVGLHAPLIDAALAGSGAVGVLQRQLGPALAVGVASAAGLIAYARVIAPRLASGPGARLAGLRLPLAAKLLYGGVTEEILTRWGLVSAFVALGGWLTGRHGDPGPVVAAAAVVVAALLFAFGHLPVVFVVAPDAPRWLIAAVVGGNFVPGALFGALFVAFGLEAAILAHMAAHALAVAVSATKRGAT